MLACVVCLVPADGDPLSAAPLLATDLLDTGTSPRPTVAGDSPRAQKKETANGNGKLELNGAAVHLNLEAQVCRGIAAQV